MIVNISNQEWDVLSHEEKNKELYFKQKNLLDQFLERGAISQDQHDKSLYDLTEKMGMKKDDVWEKVCRCFIPPEGTPFEIEGKYHWNYMIDGYVAYHESGEKWSAGDIEFYQHFQILSGKRES